MTTEFQFLGNLKKRYRLSRIGDDCAVLPKDSKTDLVITADLLVEDIDFRLAWTKPEFIGHKALAVSLSDVAAMGARPVWAMLSIGVPEKIWRSEFVEEFYQGWFNLARRYDVELIGGDVSRTPERIVIDSIVAGEIKKNGAILRSGAKPGDEIFVTGELGGAAAALKLLESGERYGRSIYDQLLLRQLAPNPQTELGQIIGEHNLATAMIDLSDGLAGDLFHLCRASNVGARLLEKDLPRQSQSENFYPVFNLTESEENLYFGGEDFELLFTAGENFFQLEKLLGIHKFSRIGTITANHEIVTVKSSGEARILEPKGFRHF